VAACAIVAACSAGRHASTYGHGGVDGGPLDSGPVDGGAADGGDGGCPLADPSCPCLTGFHRCDGVCEQDDNPQFCGVDCLSCPQPADSNATCTDGTCGFTCTNGTRLCGSSCLAEGPASCGPSCTVCPAIDNATPVCQADGGCENSCNDGFYTCSLNGQCAAPPGGACTIASDCCGGLCAQSGFCCTTTGTPCATDNDCKSNLCSLSLPLQCQNDLCCLPSGNGCTHDSDCCAPDGGTATCSNTFCK